MNIFSQDRLSFIKAKKIESVYFVDIYNTNNLPSCKQLFINTNNHSYLMGRFIKASDDNLKRMLNDLVNFMKGDTTYLYIPKDSYEYSSKCIINP